MPLILFHDLFGTSLSNFHSQNIHVIRLFLFIFKKEFVYSSNEIYDGVDISYGFVCLNWYFIIVKL